MTTQELIVFNSHLCRVTGAHDRGLLRHWFNNSDLRSDIEWVCQLMRQSSRAINSSRVLATIDCARTGALRTSFNPSW